jgi:hypothetical protein
MTIVEIANKKKAPVRRVISWFDQCGIYLKAEDRERYKRYGW